MKRAHSTRLTGLAVVTASLALSFGAFADQNAKNAPAAASSGEHAFDSTTVAVNALPTGETLTTLDRSHRPAALPKSAKVADVDVELNEPHGSGNYKSQKYLQIQSTASKSSTDSSHADMQGTCFEVAPMSPEVRAHWMNNGGSKKGHPKRMKPTPSTDDEPEAWSNNLQFSTNVSRARFGNDDQLADDRVQLLHAVTFNKTATGGDVHSRDFWVDVETGGIRLQRETHLAVKDLGGTRVGVHLYGGKVDDKVIFVADRDASVDSLMTQDGVSGMGSSSCGHMELTVPLTRGLSLTESFMVRTQRDAAKDADGEKDEAAMPSQGFGRFGSRDVFTRSGHVAVNAQWEEDESAPLVAFSSGWDTRERAQQ